MQWPAEKHWYNASMPTKPHKPQKAQINGIILPDPPPSEQSQPPEFDAAMRGLIRVPKSELDQAQEKYVRARAKRRHK
jgi:hypothetical protein